MFMRNSNKFAHRSLNIISNSSGTTGRAVCLQTSSYAPLDDRGVSTRTGNKSTGRGLSTTLNMSSKLLTLDTLNPNIKNVEYAVRGPIVQLASELEKELEQVR